MEANLTGADLTARRCKGRLFRSVDTFGTGISLAQLYSTASYQAHDLTGIGLSYNDLTGGNFAGQNLSNAILRDATVTDADFTGAEVRGANFGTTPRLCDPESRWRNSIPRLATKPMT